MKTLRVNEIFYSLQGEGAKAGMANVFIRLSGCKTKDACYASGVRCDTEFESGEEWKPEDIVEWINEGLETMHNPFASIIWTGGEPAQQLDAEIVAYFKKEGHFQAIETSGLFPVPEGLDYVAVSPKVAEHVIKKNFPHGVNELRYVRSVGQAIPEPSIDAEHYFISPHSDGDRLNQENLAHCIELVKENPEWKLSLQMHKVWKIR
mgnify:CR=1 FL=1